jgi:hypothetical protein
MESGIIDPTKVRAAPAAQARAPGWKGPRGHLLTVRGARARSRAARCESGTAAPPRRRPPPPLTPLPPPARRAALRRAAPPPAPGDPLRARECVLGGQDLPARRRGGHGDPGEERRARRRQQRVRLLGGPPRGPAPARGTRSAAFCTAGRRACARAGPPAVRPPRPGRASLWAPGGRIMAAGAPGVRRAEGLPCGAAWMRRHKPAGRARGAQQPAPGRQVNSRPGWAGRIGHRAPSSLPWPPPRLGGAATTLGRLWHG